jgi:transporter family-2 protein
VLAGALLSGQARINSALAQTFAPQDPARAAVSAAATSFTVGTLALSVVVLTTGVWRPALVAWRRERPRWWTCLGGLGGALLVGSSAYAAPLVGLALLAVAVVAGQAAGSLLVDEVGLGPAGHQPVTSRRACGAALAVGGLIVASFGRRAGLEGHLLALGLLALAGGAVSAQTAVNGRLAQSGGQPFVAALISFVGGTLALLLLAVAFGSSHHLPGPAGWWQWTGGLGGASYIALSVTAVRHIGVLGVSLASTTGQLVGGVALDAGDGRTPGGLSALGILVTLGALLVTAGRAPVVGNSTPG